MTRSTRILKWSVPVDGRDHEIGHGIVVYAVADHADTVTVWTQQTDPPQAVAPAQLAKTFARVVATGEEWDCWQWLHYATTRHDESGLVWHVLTRTDDNLGVGRATKRAEARA